MRNTLVLTLVGGLLLIALAMSDVFDSGGGERPGETGGEEPPSAARSARWHVTGMKKTASGAT